jgi:hypothetical protein
MPIKTNRRHYYEDYISRKVNDNDKYSLNERPLNYYVNSLNSCYGFHTDKNNIKNIGSYYCPNSESYYSCAVLCAPFLKIIP